MTRNTVQSWEPHRNACLGSFPSNKRASVILTVDSLKGTDEIGVLVAEAGAVLHFFFGISALGNDFRLVLDKW